MVASYFSFEAAVTGGVKQAVILPDGRAGLAYLVKLAVTSLNQYEPTPTAQTPVPPLGEYYAILSHGFALSGTLIGHHTFQAETQLQPLTLPRPEDIASQQALAQRIVAATKDWQQLTHDLSHRHVLERLNFGFTNLDLTLPAYQAQVKEVVTANTTNGANARLLATAQREQRRDWTETLKKDRANGTQVRLLVVPSWDGPLEGLAAEPAVITVTQWLDAHWRQVWFDHWLTERAAPVNRPAS